MFNFKKCSLYILTLGAFILSSCSDKGLDNNQAGADDFPNSVNTIASYISQTALMTVDINSIKEIEPIDLNSFLDMKLLTADTIIDFSDTINSNIYIIVSGELNGIHKADTLCLVYNKKVFDDIDDNEDLRWFSTIVSLDTNLIYRSVTSGIADQNLIYDGVFSNKINLYQEEKKLNSTTISVTVFDGNDENDFNDIEDNSIYTSYNYSKVNGVMYDSVVVEDIDGDGYLYNANSTTNKVNLNQWSIFDQCSSFQQIEITSFGILENTTNDILSLKGNSDCEEFNKNYLITNKDSSIISKGDTLILNEYFWTSDSTDLIKQSKAMMRIDGKSIFEEYTLLSYDVNIFQSDDYDFIDIMMTANPVIDGTQKFSVGDIEVTAKDSLGKDLSLSGTFDNGNIKGILNYDGNIVDIDWVNED